MFGTTVTAQMQCPSEMLEPLLLQAMLLASCSSFQNCAVGLVLLSCSRIWWWCASAGGNRRQGGKAGTLVLGINNGAPDTKNCRSVQSSSAREADWGNCAAGNRWFVPNDPERGRLRLVDPGSRGLSKMLPFRAVVHREFSYDNSQLTTAYGAWRPQPPSLLQSWPMTIDMFSFSPP